MTSPLWRPVNTIDVRIRRLEQKLNEELGYRDQSLRFTKVQNRNGPVVWKLRNERIENGSLVLPQGVVAELAPATNDAAILYFGYNEEWQPASSRNQIEFVSSNLRFVVSGVEEMPDLRFRLEWAGAMTDQGVVSYPGVGAAHPHWQIDIDEGWLDGRNPTSGSLAPIEIDLEPALEVVELDAPVTAPPVSPPISPTLASFHHLHLPARTLWHDLLCVMPDGAAPQQHTPESEDEIDRWVISALRYLRSEFQAYM